MGKDKVNSVNSEVNNNKDSGEKNLVSSKKIIAMVGTIILGIILTVLVQYTYVMSHYDTKMNDMWSGLKSVIVAYDNMVEKDKIYTEGNKKVIEDIAGYAAFYFEERGFTRTAYDEVVTDIGRYCVVQFYKGSIDESSHTVSGKIVADPRGITDEDIQKMFGYYKPLDEDALYTLLSTGHYEDGDLQFTAAQVKDKGYVVLIWMSDIILQDQSVMSAYTSDRDEEMMRINMDTGIIEDSSISEYIGLECDTVVDYASIYPFEEGKIYKVKLANGTPVYMIVDREENRLYCAYADELTIKLTIFRSIAFPIVLGWLFLFMILIYVLRFISKSSNSSKIAYMHLYGKMYVDRKLISHINGMSFFAIILIIVSMIYVQSLISFSNQNINGQKDLSSLDYMLNMNLDNMKTIENDYHVNQQFLITAIANYYLRFPDRLSEDNIKTLKNKMPNVYEIEFFNSKGVCEYDTGGGTEDFAKGAYVGYKLSSDADESESVCWNVLNGKTDYAYYFGEDYSEFYECSRRLDREGIVLIETSAKLLEEFSDLSDIDTIIGSAYFGSSTRLYVNNSNPGMIHIFAPGDNTGYLEKNTLSKNALEDGFSGFTRIKGVKNYIISKVCDRADVTIISAVRALHLGGIYSPFVVVVLICVFAAQVICIAFIMAVKLDTPPFTKDSRRVVNIQVKETIDEQLMDERFRKVVRNMFFSTCLMILALLGVDTLFGKTSLLSYLFGNEWSKGINLFSVTIILMMVAGAIIGGGILQSLVLFFTKNMGPRGATIGRMVSSIIKFLILIAVIFAILFDIGFDPSTLLAGAGIAGALISFCAQQTVNDFLSGFFIVFEGLFNIGDWITVNGFRGQVIEIGIRTTKIAIGGNVQIVNNSELKTITLMAPNGMGAICEVDIAYKEDVDKVIDLIKANSYKYTEAIPAIVEGPFVDGVVDLGSSGVTLYLWALADQEKVRAVERDMRRVTKDIFDANNIEIPFNQVTIHTAN